MAALAIASACGHAAPKDDFSRLPMALPDSTLTVENNDLRVAPLDVLEIKVFGVQELNGDYQVDPEGKIKFPLAGVMDAKGFTIFELASRIEDKLRGGFLQNPQVTVRITQASGQQLTVDGAVAKPGMYPMRGRVTLMQAIAIAGGTTRSADPSRVVVFRTIEGKRMAAAFDLAKIRAGQADDPVVFGNDVIIMDGSGVREGFDDFLKTVPLLGLFMVAG